MFTGMTVVRVGFILFALAVAGTPAEAQQKPSAKRKSSASVKRVPKPSSPWPSFQARHSEWVRSREAAASIGAPDPNPLAQYLVSEVIVTGLFETDTGPGAFLYAKPTGNVFFAAAGTPLYNGRVAEINMPSGGFVVEDSEVVFVERTGRKGEERRLSRRVESAPVPEPAQVAPPQEDEKPAEPGPADKPKDGANTPVP